MSDNAPPSDPELGRWPTRIEIPVAWGDMDSFGHVNNTVYLRWFESARIAYFEQIPIASRLQNSGEGPILARQTIDYRLPVTYPDRVSVATTVERIGNTSFVMAFRIFSDAQGGKEVARGDGVIVLLDYRTSSPIRVSASLRQAIREFETASCPED